MKVKIFSGFINFEVENQINNFLLNKKINLINSIQSDNGEMLTITIFYEEEKT